MSAHPDNLPPPYEGGCACGAVRFRVEAPPIGVRICHCRICQKAMASPFIVQASFPKSAVTVTGETSFWQSSPRLKRHFCPCCGTRVTIAHGTQAEAVSRGEASSSRREGGSSREEDSANRGESGAHLIDEASSMRLRQSCSLSVPRS